LANRFTYQPPEPKAFLHALRLYLETRGSQQTAALLATAACHLSPSTSYSGMRWGGLSTTVTFYVPGDQLGQFTGRVRQELLLATAAIVPKDAGLDVDAIAVAPRLEEPPVEDPNPLNVAALVAKAPVEHDGLRFRSRAETRIYDAMKRRTVLFFPNAAAVLGGSGEGIKRETDFLVCMHGKWGILEVMGAEYHPAATAMRDHDRARLFKDFGVQVVEFYDADRCYQHPDEVVDDFLRRLEERG
jgi:hypothetical protein